ncbi:hypothetical protein NUH88_00425 [Nisaea acidiphila]|uniref:Uncharacterized protein n=1 Tax=Nisaea acidiphila TaxID=1862145 RepID=A0A9J7AXM6_9PROT|nr:hypothetical protein [Nisaea acidiphila]UUX50173.1 hypothetical protein NUH88_00425 [Nisaea acidiphila]
MGRIALEDALKKPGRVITWHAGERSRSHKTSTREDYITVVPKELAGMLPAIGSTTTLYEFLELFVEELLYERLEAERANPDAISLDAAPILELRGYFERWMEFYVREVIPPLPDPGGAGGAAGFVDAIQRSQPRWLILANQNARSEAKCLKGFETLIDVAETVAGRFDLRLDLEMARNGFRSMLRRRAEAEGRPTDWSLLDLRTI